MVGNFQAERLHALQTEVRHLETEGIARFKELAGSFNADAHSDAFL
jgi:hypothetical protein